MKNIIKITIGFFAGATITALAFYFFVIPKPVPAKHFAPFTVNIVKAAADNQDFRHVLFTGDESQLVIMNIPAGGEVGAETHKRVEQILYFQSGTGQAILDGKITPIIPGDVVVVTPGTPHNFTNTGKDPLKIITTYAPPNHIDGRIQRTKADADADTADEAFGESR